MAMIREDNNSSTSLDMNNFFHDDEVIVHILSFLDFDSVYDVVSKTCVRFNSCSRRAMICSLGKKKVKEEESTREEDEIQDACSLNQEQSQIDPIKDYFALIPSKDVILRCFYEEGVHVILRQGWSVWSQNRLTVLDEIDWFIEHKTIGLPRLDHENGKIYVSYGLRLHNVIKYPDHFLVLQRDEDECEWTFWNYEDNVHDARVKVLNELNKIRLIHDNNNNNDGSESLSDHMDDNDNDIRESDNEIFNDESELYNNEEGNNEGDDDSDMFVSDNESIDYHSFSDGSDGISVYEEVTDNDLRILNHYLKCMIRFNEQLKFTGWKFNFEDRMHALQEVETWSVKVLMPNRSRFELIYNKGIAERL